jgi:protein ImuA
MEDLRLHMARLTGPTAPGPDLPVMGDMALRLGRVHEFCGPARRTLALRVAARLDGPVIWVRPGWQAERLNPEGVVGLGVEPARLIFVDPRKVDDILWSAEESLRAGAVALVVCELHSLPGLTPVRRLHLAAEAGAQVRADHGGKAPLGLLLAQARGGVPGVESRWYMTCTHKADAQGWRLERRRARTAPPMAWHLDPGGQMTPTGQPPMGLG